MNFFTENWFHHASCDRLAQLGRQVEHVPGMIIEIGSWEGRSTSVLANAIRPRIVHAVDTWQGSPGEISSDLAAERDVHATFASRPNTPSRFRPCGTTRRCDNRCSRR
jgi:hypothetical protein